MDELNTVFDNLLEIGTGLAAAGSTGCVMWGPSSTCCARA